MKDQKWFCLVLVTVLSLYSQAALSIPAFPGAEGFGSQTIGGRGGTVVKVTNLNDSGPGSFRDAVVVAPKNYVTGTYVWESTEAYHARLEAAGHKIIVFEVSGIINLETEIEIKIPYLTIAGETSPGGILITGRQVGINTHDVIMRHMRFRVGSHRVTDGTGADPETLDSFDLHGNAMPNWYDGPGASNVIIDHCSFSWGVDETFAAGTGANNFTVQWSIFSEGLSYAGHPKGEHSKGVIFSFKYGAVSNVSFHHNYLASNRDRNPLVSGPGNGSPGDQWVDVRNNLIYNFYGALSMTAQENGAGNWVHNYVKRGPESASFAYEMAFITTPLPDANNLLYVEGNLGARRLSQSDPQWSVGEDWYNRLASTDHQRLTPYDITGGEVTTEIASLSMADNILAKVGATAPVRDSVDQRVIADFSAGTGAIIHNVIFPDDFPTFQNISPPTDNDNDGMADAWEQQRGLNTSADDSAGDDDGDEYTNIEEYLHYLSDRSISGTNNPPVLDPVQNIEVTEGETVTFTPSATDPDGDPLTYQYSGWMTSDSYTTTVGDAGVHTVTITVSDGELSDAQDVTVTVNTQTNNTAPTTPSNLTATAISRSEVSLTWSPSTDDVAVSGYRIYRDGVAVATSTGTNFSDTGLEAKTRYSYQVSAYDTEGNESNKSAAAKVRTLARPSNSGPGRKPTSGISANGNGGNINLSTGEPLTIRISLDPGDQTGQPADWWAAASTPFGFYWYVAGTGWVRSDSPLLGYNGSLVTIPPSALLYNAILPPGVYTFYFAVDDNQDGILNAHHLDYVSVTIP